MNISDEALGEVPGCILLRWSLRVFFGRQDSCDLAECIRLYGLGRPDDFEVALYVFPLSS